MDSGSSEGLPDYSGASAADSHRFPYLCSIVEHHQFWLAFSIHVTSSCRCCQCPMATYDGLMTRIHDTGSQPLGRVVMLQGTGSSVGKSLLVTGFCRVFAQDGYRVAPFKAQNMSRNSGVTPDGLEIGRAQVVQAEAAGIEPTVEMNPVLLKPEGNATSQLISMGKMNGTLQARDFLTRRELLWTTIKDSLDSLRRQYDIVVVEGAGSPAEINLRAGDIVNMAVALYADAPVFIIGDIDKGGVFASLYGTNALISEEERALVKGFIINKFRGDPSLLGDGLDQLKVLTGVDVIGVVPYLSDVYVPEEDSPREARRSFAEVAEDHVEIAVVALPRIANFDEFDTLALRSGVHLRYVRRASDFGEPDLVILPGSKLTVADLDFVRGSGIESKIREHVWNGRALIGICGGLQMLGNSIHDPEGIESDQPFADGLGILDIETAFAGDKLTTRTDAKILADRGLLAGARELKVSGYEIHVGMSDGPTGTSVAMESLNGGNAVGFLDSTGRVFGTYLHDLFKNDAFTQTVVTNLARMKGLAPSDEVEPFSQDAEFEKLAAHLRRHLDIGAVYRSMGL